MKKFWKSKRFWAALILIGIGGFIYYSPNKEIISNEKPIEEEYEEDNYVPYSQIKPTSDNGWHNKDFEINVLDEDIGSGIKEDSCQYKVISYGPNNEEISSGWKKRKCNDTQTISVGPEGKCSSEGKESCWIYVRSQDKTGNWYAPSEGELSIKSYNIDWTNPYTGKTIIDEENNKAQVEVTDSFKILGCLLYINGENQGSMNFLDSRCYNQCFLEKDFILPEIGNYNIYAYCKDLAGNWGKGEISQITVNTPPSINSCRASTASGNKNTEIQFTVEAEDIDNDSLSFFWDFGDETSSQEQNPTHTYSTNGTYRPIVTVFDENNGESSCSTIWITITE